jgi:hypothetical protein
MLTVNLVLVLIAIGLTFGSVFTPPKAPLWAAVFVLCLIALLQVLPR